MDCESTHRRTLFNVSLTFLFPISDPRSPGKRQREREDRRRQQCSACTSPKVTSPRQSQGSGFIIGPANQDAGGGDGLTWEAEDSTDFTLCFVYLFISCVISHPQLLTSVPRDLGGVRLRVKPDLLRSCNVRNNVAKKKKRGGAE